MAARRARPVLFLVRRDGRRRLGSRARVGGKRRRRRSLYDGIFPLPHRRIAVACSISATSSFSLIR